MFCCLWIPSAAEGVFFWKYDISYISKTMYFGWFHHTCKFFSILLWLFLLMSVSNFLNTKLIRVLQMMAQIWHHHWTQLGKGNKGPYVEFCCSKKCVLGIFFLLPLLLLSIGLRAKDLGLSGSIDLVWSDGAQSPWSNDLLLLPCWDNVILF